MSARGMVGRRLAGVAFLLVPALLVWLSIAVYDKKFTEVSWVTQETASAGGEMHPHADVKLRGVVAGEVREISSDGAATPKLAIQPDKVRLLPRNVSAQLLPTTLFGQRFVATFGFWTLHRADAVRDDPSARNTALTDSAATSEVKGAVADMVGRVFSFTYTDPARTQKAARDALTGKAVHQYEEIFAKVRRDAPGAKTVLSTRVTDSAVTTLTGDRAVVLVFADQQTTRTTDGTSTHAPAMLTVTAVHRDGHWRITALDPFTDR